jgi:hypothetical protein
MATINPAQDYDIIQTLTFAEASGTCNIRLYRGSNSAYTGTVKVRAGTSGAWSDLSVSGTATTFNVTSTTMQIAHDWNKSGNNYMTCSFDGQSTNLTKIAISQKAILSGAIGNYFMYRYAFDCSLLTSLDVPDTSGITTVDGNFMQYYAYGCSKLTSLSVPDTSDITTVSFDFMTGYARGCTGLTSISAPDTSSITSISSSFMSQYAFDCSKLTSLGVPDTSNISGDVGIFFMSNYASNCSKLTSLGVPNTSGITSAGMNFMSGYANGCTALTKLVLPSVGWFATHDVSWGVPSGRLTYLKGEVLDSADLAGWQALTTDTSPNTLYINYIRNTADVYSSDTDATNTTNFFMFI